MTMRKIKFRGKSLNDKKWGYGFYCRHDYGAHYQDKKLIKAACSVHDIWTPDGWVAVDEASIGQFTGLTDRNGKEIYEGDIVKACSQGEHRLCEVAWSENTVSFFLKHPAGAWYLSGAWGNESCEVIGNVFDNPELLPYQPTVI